jgi:scyllo-inositol 2-dehydrogenase (NADP+)
MITVGIIGFGLSGRYLQAPFFLDNPNFKLKTIVSNSQNPTAIYPSVQKASSLDNVLKDTEIDLVSICSPNDTHFEYAQKCLLAGKHVLVEKPMTATPEEAEELIALSKKTGKHLFIFQNRRFDSDFMTVKKVIESGVLGHILNYEAHYNRFKPILNPKKWKETVSSTSGILYDLGAHIIDQAVHLFGTPLSSESRNGEKNPHIWGQTFTQREGSEVDDAFNINLDYGKLKVVLRSSLLVREETPRYIIHGTKGSFIKYGIDMQEDHLKVGIMPDNPAFGYETPQPASSADKYRGVLNSEINGLTMRGTVETERGNWGILFQNIYEVIAENAEPLIPLTDIVEQLRIIQQVRTV